MATVGQYVPVWAQSAETGTAGYKTLARAAYNISISDFDVAVGGYYIGGDIRDMNTSLGNVFEEDGYDTFDRVSYGFDFQVEGSIDNMTLMVTGGYVLNNEFTADALATSKSDETGFSIGAQLNPTELFGAKLAYLSFADNNNDINDNSTVTLGAEYNFAQNVRFMLEYSMTDYANDTSKEQEKDALFMAMIAF